MDIWVFGENKRDHNETHEKGNQGVRNEIELQLDSAGHDCDGISFRCCFVGDVVWCLRT